MSANKLHLASGSLLAIVAKVVGFLSTILLSRALGIGGFGEYGLILTTLSLFGLAAQASLGSASSTLLARNLTVGPDRAGATLGTVCTLLVSTVTIASALLLVATPAIQEHVFKGAAIQTGLRLGVLALGILAATSVLDGFLAGMRLFFFRNLMPVLQSASLVALTIVLAPKFGVSGAVLALTASYAISFAAGLYGLISNVRTENLASHIKFDSSIALDIARFSAPLVANNILVVATNWALSFLISKYTIGFENVGAFSAANQLRLVVLTIPFLIQSTYAPLVTSAYRDLDKSDMRNYFLKCMSHTNFFAGGPGLFMSTFSIFFMLLFGRAFSGHADILVLTASTAIVAASANWLGIFVIALGHSKLSVIPNILYAISVCIFGAAFIPRFGGLGATIAILISQISQYVTLAIIARKYISIHRFAYLSPVALSALAAVCGYLVNSGSTALMVSAWCLSTACALFLLRDWLNTTLSENELVRKIYRSPLRFLLTHGL